MLSKLKTKLATVLVSFERGKYWLSYINFLLILFLTVQNLRQYKYFNFLNSFYILIALIVISLILLILIGYYDLKTGIYRRETEVQAHLNPIQSKILNELAEIKNKVNLLEKRRK